MREEFALLFQDTPRFTGFFESEFLNLIFGNSCDISYRIITVLAESYPQLISFFNIKNIDQYVPEYFGSSGTGSHVSSFDIGNKTGFVQIDMSNGTKSDSRAEAAANGISQARATANDTSQTRARTRLRYQLAK